MVLLKADSNMCRYADEILRFLVHQLFILSEEEAHIMFYGMFVNTKGKIDSFIPCDLMMEFVVRTMKKHIKHMYSNKTERNIERKTGALASLDALMNNYDVDSSVIRRNKKHRKADVGGDELSMAEDLHSLSPFQVIPGRKHEQFENVSCSLLSSLNYDHFLRWVTRRAEIHATSLGN